MGLKVYLDCTTGGSQVVMGVTGEFKFNFGTTQLRRRRGTQVLQLGPAKPDMVTVLAEFQAAKLGTRVDPEEFLYISPDQMLRITNISNASGLTDAGLIGSEDYAIPINYIPAEKVVLTTIHGDPKIVQ